MTTIHVCRLNVIYYMYITGYNSFFVSMYNDTIFENYFINELNDRGEFILNQHSPLRINTNLFR